MSRPRSASSVGRRLWPPVVLVAAVVGVGTFALVALGRGRFGLFDAFYFIVNAVSTVGFKELDGMDQVPFSHGLTVLVILAGLGTVAYFQASLTAVLFEGIIGQKFRERRMQSSIDKMSDHIIVAGAGSTGLHVIEELAAAGARFVAIDRSREVLERVSRENLDGKMLFVVGDATNDAVLSAAGVDRARGVVAALTEDKDNLFVTLSARSMNGKARIVAKVIEPESQAKMVRAGANSTVSPNMIGGRRLASEIVRPTVVEFIDQMLHHKQELKLEEVVIPSGSSFIGKTLREVPIRSETNLLVIAMRVERAFTYNPEPSTKLENGSVLVVLGERTNVERLRALVTPR